MSEGWTQSAREEAYTSLCEAITATGAADETLFLARLVLLLAEELADPAGFARALSSAAIARDEPADSAV